MKMRRTVRVNDRQVVVIVRCADARRAEGKYLVGVPAQGVQTLTIVLDDSCSFHKDIAFRYSLRPLGGGWCVLDHEQRKVSAGGKSHAYGIEPDRGIVLEAFGSTFPGYMVLPLE